MPESRGKGLKPPKVDYNLKFLGLYAFLGISFSYLKLTHGKPLCTRDFNIKLPNYDLQKCSSTCPKRPIPNVVDDVWDGSST